MGLIPVMPGFNFGDGRGLRVYNDVVDRPLLSAVNAVDRKRSGDVCCISVDLCTRIDQEQITINQFVAVFGVVQNAAVCTAGNNRGIGRRVGTAF